MSLTPESEADLVRQIAYALEDGSVDPLGDVRDQAPEHLAELSELERAVADWSLAYGVAWTLVKIRDPFAPAARTTEVSLRLAREAWRTRGGGDSWFELISRDRGERGLLRDGPGEPLEGFTHSLGQVRVARAPEASHTPPAPAAETPHEPRAE